MMRAESCVSQPLGESRPEAGDEGRVGRSAARRRGEGSEEGERVGQGEIVRGAW